MLLCPSGPFPLSFSFTFCYIYILPTLSVFGIMIHKKMNESKRNQELPSHSFSCYVIIFSLSGWLAQGSNIAKKGYSRTPQSFVFLRIQFFFFFLFLLENFTGLYEKNVACQDFQCLCLPFFHFEFYGTSTYSESIRIFCSWTSQILYVNGAVRNVWTCI